MSLALAMIVSHASAQTADPQPAPAPNPTDAVIGSWGLTHAACISRYGSHRPNYNVAMELSHTRNEFVLSSKIREESCRIEGSYSVENSKLSYQTKDQECAIAKLSEQLKPEVEDGWMLISLDASIADKVCPARNSVLRLYLIRR